LHKYALVLVGGGVGALLRYIVATAVLERYGGKFPLATFLINVTGSFLIGLLMTLLTDRYEAHEGWRLLLVVGLLGGYTTFSSFEWDTYRSVRQGSFGHAFFNVFGSVLCGYVALLLGVFAAGRR